MIKEILLDSRCILCGSKNLSSEIKYVCKDCLAAFQHKLDGLCPICAHPLINGTCPSHNSLGTIYYDSYKFIQTYTGFFKTAVYKLKKQDEFMVNKLMFDLLLRSGYLDKEIPITIVPDNWFKAFRRGRGSLYYVLKLLEKNGYKTIKNIYNRKFTLRGQKSKTKFGRIEQIQNLYYLKPENVSKYSGPIYLLDDVYTSGATLNYGAKLLKEAGFDSVYCISFFRAIIGEK